MKDWYWLKPLLALMIVVAFVLMLFTLLKAAVPADNNDVLMVLLGAMVGIVRDIYSYFFGASEAERGKPNVPITSWVPPSTGVMPADGLRPSTDQNP